MRRVVLRHPRLAQTLVNPLARGEIDRIVGVDVLLERRDRFRPGVWRGKILLERLARLVVVTGKREGRGQPGPAGGRRGGRQASPDEIDRLIVAMKRNIRQARWDEPGRALGIARAE